MRKKFLFWAMFFCVGLFTFMCKSNLAFGEDFTCNNNTYRTLGDDNVTLIGSTNTTLTIPEQIFCYTKKNAETGNIIETLFEENFSNKEEYTITTYSVTQIDANYNNFTNCKEMFIPKSVTTINSPEFLLVKKFTVNENNNSFCSDETGVLFNKDKTKLIRFPVAVYTDTDYTIPESVNTIATKAFSMGINSDNYITPHADISIRFSSTELWLEERDIFVHGTYQTIDLKNCPLSLDEFNFSVVTIDTFIFPKNTVVLNTIPDEVNVIQLPSTITLINIDSLCSMSTSLQITNYDGSDYNTDYFLFEDGVLFNKNKTFLIRFLKDTKNYVVPDTVTAIGTLAFYGSDLTTVTLPEKLEVLMHGCFSDCQNLSSVTIPKSVKSIDYVVFMECQQLKTIKILGEPSVGYYAFMGCPLDTIIIPCTFDKSRFTVSCSIPLVAIDDSDKFYYSLDGGFENRNYEGKFEYLHSPMYNSDVNKIICTNCGKEVTSIPEHSHEFAEANCSSPALCTICGMPKNYSDMNTNPHNHVWELEPTTGYPKCKLCGTGSATSSKKVIITRTANDFVYNNMSWDELGFIKKES